MKIKLEFIVSLIILFILATFLNAKDLLMPNSTNMMLIVGLIIGFLAFVGLVWKEKAVDERDDVHILKSGRISFFVGAFILVVGIANQALMHDIDPWLIYSLASMVLVKLISRIFHYFRN
ncbi:MAG: hypothetical protein ACOZAK_03045 [Patescibacteria group bacterium]